jgi:hypothetical protein
MKLVKLDAGDGGALGDRAVPGFAMYGFTGFTTKAGTYLVTVKYRMRLTSECFSTSRRRRANSTALPTRFLSPGTVLVFRLNSILGLNWVSMA